MPAIFIKVMFFKVCGRVSGNLREVQMNENSRQIERIRETKRVVKYVSL